MKIMQNKEYDEFGPWILEINTIEDIPKLFIPYCSEIDDALLLIKIPRNIERRNANPNMDLYDYVLGVYEEYLIILKRDSKNIEVIEIKFKDVIAITNRMDLLLGIVTFYLSKKIISFNYSVVSGDIIRRLLKLIRERYAPNSNFIFEGLLDYNLIEDVDSLYINLLSQFAKPEDHFKVLAIQSSVKAIPIYTSIGKKIMDLLNIYKENLLQNTMYLTNEKELLIVTRGKTFRRPKAINYTYDFTYIPISKIVNIRFDSISEYDNISPFFIEIQDHSFKYYFDNANNQREQLSKILFSHF